MTKQQLLEYGETALHKYTAGSSVYEEEHFRQGFTAAVELLYPLVESHMKVCRARKLDVYKCVELSMDALYDLRQIFNKESTGV